jgi:hypothetical protein
MPKPDHFQIFDEKRCLTCVHTKENYSGIMAQIDCGKHDFPLTSNKDNRFDLGYCVCNDHQSWSERNDELQKSKSKD